MRDQDPIIPHGGLDHDPNLDLRRIYVKNDPVIQKNPDSDSDPDLDPNSDADTGQDSDPDTDRESYSNPDLESDPDSDSNSDIYLYHTIRIFHCTYYDFPNKDLDIWNKLHILRRSETHS
ncbi:hypothetical protein L3X38_022667 [Prunus dulcis]|uniref:Uncharacterized protein n=1 Tax=Prunus dulcis TaxID=3755 RepID=A0AAD4VWJ0_PRUDU|nr:hypothetical protein L3X38_022667 [Prunus dulcis]